MLKRQINELIRKYGGRQTCINVIILENIEIFSYIDKELAHRDDKAKDIVKKKTSSYSSPPPGVKSINWGEDHISIFIQDPQKLKTNLTPDQYYQRRKQLGLPIRKYVKKHLHI